MASSTTPARSSSFTSQIGKDVERSSAPSPCRSLRRDAPVTVRPPKSGPLLIIDGEKDHTVPWAIANAAYKLQRRNPGVTEVAKMPNRGHSLTIDHGWREVADAALTFVKRFA